jgi:hypothetical protein
MKFLNGGLIFWKVDEISRKWMKMAVSSEADEKNSISGGMAQRRSSMERPGWPRYLLGEQGKRIPGRVPNRGWTGACRRRTDTQRRVHGCPTESESVPTEGAMGARRRAGLGGWPNGGSRGWPDKGLYKCCWPSFLGTVLQRPVSPTRNAGAQGANE